MAGGKSRSRGGGAKRGARSGAPARRRARETKPAEPLQPVLGNDPFVRGAAPREPAPTVTRDATPAPTPLAPFDESGPARGAPVEPRAGEDAAPPPPSSVAARATERLSALEHRVEETLDGLEHRLADVASRAGLAPAAGELKETIARLLPRVRHALGMAVDLARLVEPPERLDRHGLDARFYERAQPLLDLLYSTWWRVEARGIERVPATGPAIVVANHGGVVPWDALVLRHALRRDHPARRDLRPLLDHREAELPLFGAVAIRLGAVRAAPEPAERILRDGGLVGVFPEGSAAARKSWAERYRLQRFGRGGFAKLALRTGAPVVPCAIVGSEEASPAIARPGWLAAALGVGGLAGSSLRLGAAGPLPLPSRWSLRFGDPIAPGARPEAADDPGAVNALSERVRDAVQRMLDEDVAARGSVFL